jgi:hypothetical protein
MPPRLGGFALVLAATAVGLWGGIAAFVGALLGIVLDFETVGLDLPAAVFDAGVLRFITMIPILLVIPQRGPSSPLPRDA